MTGRRGPLSDRGDRPAVVRAPEPEVEVGGVPHRLPALRHHDVLPPAPGLGLVAVDLDALDLQDHSIAAGRVEDVAVALELVGADPRPDSLQERQIPRVEDAAVEAYELSDLGGRIGRRR